MYSNSSDDLIGLLLEGLERLKEERPEHLALVCRRLGGRGVELTLDDQILRLQFSEDHWQRVASLRADLQIWVDRSGVVDLLAGRIQLTDAVLDGVLGVRGGVDDLADGLAAMRAFLSGAVRAPSFPALRQRLEAMEPT